MPISEVPCSAHTYPPSTDQPLMTTTLKAPRPTPLITSTPTQIGRGNLKRAQGFRPRATKRQSVSQDLDVVAFRSLNREVRAAMAPSLAGECRSFPPTAGRFGVDSWSPLPPARPRRSSRHARLVLGALAAAHAVVA